MYMQINTGIIINLDGGNTKILTAHGGKDIRNVALAVQAAAGRDNKYQYRYRRADKHREKIQILTANGGEDIQVDREKIETLTAKGSEGIQIENDRDNDYQWR